MHPTSLIAENHICISRTLFDEGMRAVEPQAYKRSIKKLALILLLLYFGVAAWLLYTGGSLFFLAGESIFLGALFFWLFFMLPASKRRSKYNAMAQGGNDLPERTVQFYQEHLYVITNTGKKTFLSYSDILDWKETPNLYILNCRNHLYVLLDKHGFVTGDFQVVCERMGLRS